MKVVCPECSASFDVPVPLLGSGGRRVRCGNCGHIWLQDTTPPENAFGGFRPAPGGDDIDPIPASLHPLPHDAQDDEDEDNGPGFFADVKWGSLGRMVGGFLCGAGLMAALTYALATMNLVPNFLMPAAVAMGAAHVSDAAGLELQDVSARIEQRGEDSVTAIYGTLYNTGGAVRTIPMLIAMAVSPDGETLADPHHFKPEQDRLQPGESIPFSVEIKTPLRNDAQIKLEFVSE